MTYDLLGRALTTTRPDGSVVRYGYDAGGNVTSIVVPKGAEHTYTFGKAWRKLGYGVPHGGAYGYTCDDAGRPRTITSPSGSVIEDRYTNGLLTSVAAGSDTIAFTRHPSGRLDAITRGCERSTFTYDGSLLKTDARTGVLNTTLSYAYNSDFAPTSFTYAGAAQTYGYDADGLMTSAAPFTIARRADNGLPTAVTATGFSLARGFSGYGEMDATTVTVNAAARYGYQLTRDAAGRVATRTETIGGESIASAYGYDALGRLVSVTRDGALAESYAYDADGNRTASRVPLRGVDSTVSATFGDDDRILTSAGATYTVDADGYVTGRASSEGTATFAYSALGELTSAHLADGRTVAYDYDGFGRRVAKRVNAAITERYLWGDGTHLLATYDAAGALTARFTYADGRMPYRMTKGSTSYYPAYDQVGSLRLVTDASGNTVKRLDYDSFGNVVSDSNPAFKVPLGFAGGLADADTGLVHFGARDYEPGTGRWMQKDPLSLGGGLNVYAYAEGNPVNLVDPSGLRAMTCKEYTEYWARQAQRYADQAQGWEVARQAARNVAYVDAAVGTMTGIGALYQAGPAIATWWAVYGPASLAAGAGGGAVGFHHTTDEAAESIMGGNGLIPGSYATPDELTPLQAHIDLALNPAGGARNAILEIDVAGLEAAGYDIPAVTRVSGQFGMAGGGQEMEFPYEIPVEFLKRVQ